MSVGIDLATSEPKNLYSMGDVYIFKNWGYVPNGLVKGVVCEVSDIKNKCWGKIPSGWINLNYCKKE